MNRPCLSSVIFVVFLLLSTIASSNETSIRLAAEDSWPPFADAAGEGLSHRLIAKAFALEGIEVDTLVVPYNRGLILTEQGKVNAVFNVAMQQNTRERFLFGEEPLFVATASFYQLSRKAPVAADKWSLPEDTRVGIVRGYEYGDEFDSLPNMVLKIVDNQYQLINLLLTDKVDAVVMYDRVAAQFLDTMGVNSEVRAVIANHSSELFVAFDKNNPNSPALAGALDKGLKQLKASGEYHSLIPGVTSAPQGLRKTAGGVN
ncbi:ABC transporter substrate-binding protein [Shewanella sp. FJAT-52076]|uniref:substrate-binding periplasmic protein n=1 Tax=Shewanella sp. FJAT-52076 TaxID=2864202 RepID=UPI001C65AF34|nr:transporter substrate-binding domain-containing protein [Shewanella sp. FJAT-52076]QYJ76362.1 transporter substrate-binding domain-containing protein [Shewanella sp. FJAT-52076]